MSSKGDRPRTVPKFGSFQPKPKPSSNPDPTSSVSTDADAPARADSRVSQKHESHRREDERDRRHSHRGRHSGHSGPQEGRAIEVLQHRKPPASDLFTIDRRGDPLIIRYGGNDRASVPKYRHIGRGMILGANGYLEIHRDGARDQFSIRTSRERGSAFRDKSLLAQAGRSKPKLFKKYTDQAPSLVTEEFISVEPSKKRKRGDDEEQDSGSEHDRPSYRSIEGKAKPQEDSDSAFESSGADVGSETCFITPTKKRSIELSRTVKEHPENTQAWLDLIGLQDRLFREYSDNEHIRTKDEAKALADIKVSMFEKALSHVRTAENREKVLIGLVREGAMVWTSQKLAKRWIEISEQVPDSFALWKSRMDFELSNISTFSYEDIKQRFVDRLRFLGAKVLGETGSKTSQRDLAEQAIYVFLRLTRFLHEAGFVDLAVGAWQAMLELHFARPHSTASDESAMSSLGEFWESEVPRLGEAAAAGWKRFAEAESMADFPEGRHPAQIAKPRTRDAYKAWVATECRQALEARLPAKTADEGTEEDPYRVVMFGDIERLLVMVPDHLIPGIRLQLIDAYLLFCGLPPAFGSSGLLSTAVTDPFIYGGSRDFDTKVKQAPKTPGTSIERQRQPPNFEKDGLNMVISPEVLFSRSGWFKYMISWRELYPEHDEPVARSYILTTVRQLVRLLGVEELAEYHLALEWLNEPSSAKKVAKAVLKQYPSNSGLYNGYALIEWANGNLEVAQKVLSSATSQQLASEVEGQALRNTWAWMELEAGQKSRALARLCSSVNDQQEEMASSALFLKTKSGASVRRDYAISCGKMEDAFHYATSLALLSYLFPGDAGSHSKEPRSSDQGDITAAMASIHVFSADLFSRGMRESRLHERFLQFAARLLYFHVTQGPFRPVYIRAQLLQFLDLFPQNSIFLSIFAWAESSLRIDDPVRTLLRDKVLIDPHDSVSARIFAIGYELEVGTVHSARAAFESAIESETCRCSSRLWMYYVRFCYARKELRDKAKDVFYRGIAACPGSKQLYLEVFTTLIKEMSSSDLRAVFSTIESKGLRIHVDLHEFIQQWQANQAERDVGLLDRTRR